MSARCQHIQHNNDYGIVFECGLTLVIVSHCTNYSPRGINKMHIIVAFLTICSWLNTTMSAVLYQHNYTNAVCALVLILVHHSSVVE